MGCCKHPCLAGYCSVKDLARSTLPNLTPSGSAAQKKPSISHLPSPFQPASKTAAARLHPDPPLLSRLKPCQACAPKVPLSSVAYAGIHNNSPLCRPQVRKGVKVTQEEKQKPLRFAAFHSKEEEGNRNKTPEFYSFQQ